jgi:L-ribulose-5-phosphate 3-epimerase
MEIIDMQAISSIKHLPPFVTGFALQSYLSAEEGIHEAAVNQYSYWYIDGSVSTEAPSAWSEKRIANINNMISKLQVRPVYHGNYKVPLASDVPELRMTAIEYTKKEIALAAQLSASIIIHGGVVVEPRLVTKVKQKAIENYLDSIKILTNYAETKKVQIFLENLSNYKKYKPFHYIFTHEEEFDFILRELPSVRLLLDLGHANICEGKPIQLIKKYYPHIAAMSLSNNNGNKDQHLALHKGSIDYKEVVETIISVGWKGIIAFETRGRSPLNSANDLLNLYHHVTSVSTLNNKCNTC